MKKSHTNLGEAILNEIASPVIRKFYTEGTILCSFSGGLYHLTETHNATIQALSEKGISVYHVIEGVWRFGSECFRMTTYLYVCDETVSLFDKNLSLGSAALDGIVTKYAYGQRPEYFLDAYVVGPDSEYGSVGITVQGITLHRFA